MVAMNAMFRVASLHDWWRSDWQVGAFPLRDPALYADDAHGHIEAYVAASGVRV
jgi:hypothetical protein